MAEMTALALRQALSGLAHEAGRIALRHYRQIRVKIPDAEFEIKPNDTIVTAADQEVEAFLRGRLPDLGLPAAYIGEETIRDEDAVRAARDSEWVWVVDPIDGTAGFVDGLALFGVSIGLLRNGRPYAGVLFFPALNHLYTAVQGAGAEYDGERVQVLDEEPHPDRRVLYVSGEAHREFHIHYPGKTRSLASAALHFALVARGVAVGALSTAHVWDFAGAAAILQEAGGVLKHLNGGDIDWRDALDGKELEPAVLGTPPRLWDTVVRSIAPLHAVSPRTPVPGSTG